MLKVKRKYFDRGETRKLKEIKAVVIHWPAGRVTNIEALWKWMNKSSQNSYHFLVSKEKIIQTRHTDYRAIHCGHRTYRKKAKDFFGYDVCSSKDSPNNYTIGVCMLHDNENGSYDRGTINNAIELLAVLCIDNNLSPETDMLRHSDITNEKSTPCPKAFFEDDDDPDDLWKSFKFWVAAEITKIYKDIGMTENLEQKYDNIDKEK